MSPMTPLVCLEGVYATHGRMYPLYFSSETVEARRVDLWEQRSSQFYYENPQKTYGL